MTVDAMGYTLALLTLGMSMVAARHRNMLLTLGATALWVTLLNFILANTVAGLGWLSLFVISAFTFMAGFALLSFISRRGILGEGKITHTDNSREVAETEGPMGTGMGRTTIMEEPEDEYRQRVRRALHPRRRR